METLVDKVLEDASYHVVMAVFHENDSIEFIDFYSDVKKYLGKYATLEIATVGYESEEVPRPHHHAHILIKQTGRIPNSLVTCFKSWSDKKYEKNTISLRKTDNKDIKDLKLILQYPLKEKPLRELSFGLDDETFDSLTKDATAIYDAEKLYKKKQRIKQQRIKDGWNKKKNWVKNKFKEEGTTLDNYKDEIMQRVATLFIKYYVEEEDANLPYKNKMESEVLKYCIQETSVSIVDIQKKYYRM